MQLASWAKREYSSLPAGVRSHKHRLQQLQLIALQKDDAAPMAYYSFVLKNKMTPQPPTDPVLSTVWTEGLCTQLLSQKTFPQVHQIEGSDGLITCIILINTNQKRRFFVQK